MFKNIRYILKLEKEHKEDIQYSIMYSSPIFNPVKEATEDSNMHSAAAHSSLAGGWTFHSGQ